MASWVTGGNGRSVVSGTVATGVRCHCVVILVMISRVATCMAPVIPAE